MKKAGFEAGFARVSLKPAMTIDKRFIDDVDARAMVVRGGGRLAALVAADIVSIRGHLALPIRERVAGELGVPAAHVGVFSTHNHGARTPEMDVEKFGAACAEAAARAAARLEPAEVARASARPASPLCIRRRITVPGIGAFTFWFGHRDLGNGRADGSHLLKLDISRLATGNPSPIRSLTLGQEPAAGDFQVPDAPLAVDEPVLFPEAADDLLQALFFRSPDGRPIGSLLRFPAHAVTANRGDVDWRSGDFPTYACARLEETFGGSSLFVPGPSGDQCPIVERKRLALARALGAEIGDLALKGLTDAEWERTGPFDVAAPEVRLKAREERLLSGEEAEAEKQAIEKELARLAGPAAPIARMKTLSERHETLCRVLRGKPGAWGDLSAEDAVGNGFSHPGFALRIGSSTIAGFPGEPFAGYAVRLRRETGLGDALIALEVANGHIGYFPTREEYPLGGYEAADSDYTPDSEDRMTEALKSGIASLAV